MVIEGIKNQAELIRNKNIFASIYDQNKEFYVNHILNNYLKQENEEIARYNLEKSAKKIQEEKIKPKKIIDDPEITFDNKYENKYKKMGFIFKFGEIILIFILLFYIDNMMNDVPIKDLSIFNSKVLSIFDEDDYCTEKFNLITSPDSLNSWMKGCYLNT